MNISRVLTLLLLVSILSGCGNSPAKNNPKLLYEGRYISAIDNNDLDSIKEMEQRGYRTTMMVRKTDSKYPIHYAIRHGKIDSIPFFKKVGYDINAFDEGMDYSPLMLAFSMENRKAIKILVEIGADLNATNSHGLTLSYFLNNTDMELARYLLDLGIDPELSNKEGYVLLKQLSNKPSTQVFIAKEISDRQDSALKKGEITGLEYELQRGDLAKNLWNGEEAIKHYTSAADQGSLKAYTSLADIYFDGHAVKINYPEALNWYKKAALKGDVFSMYMVGVIYERGLGVPQDFFVAFKWFKKSADLGQPIAQNNIGAMLDRGLGVKQNRSEAFKWYKKSAEQGVSEAQNSLAVFYKQGIGVERDLVKAFEWHEKSALQKNICSQADLGYFYKKGFGVNQSYSKSVEWLEVAIQNARLNLPDRILSDYDSDGINGCYSNALNNLGVIVYNGQGGVQREKSKGLSLFMKSCELGNKEGCANFKGIRLYR